MAKKKTIADQLASAFIHHDVQLSRLEAHHQKMILKDLKLVEKRLVADLATRAGESFTKARSQALLHDVHETIKTGYKAVYETNKQQLLDLGAYEAKAVPRIVNGVIGAKVMSVGVPQSVIESMVKEDIAIGAPLKTFWGKQAATLQENFTKEVRAGIFAGSTPEQMIQRVRGTKAKSFKDGIMSTSRRGAAAVVRTASQSVLNDARMELYTRNSDVLNGVQVQATLDARTTDICISRSGAAWDNNGDPLPGTDTGEDFPGPPPWHVNCRSTLIPVVKSFGEILDDAELNAKIEEEMKNLPKATQASMDGHVAADLTYEDWLEDQSEEFQKEILGPGKWELWNNEQIGMRDLIDQTGRPMTIKELKQASTFGGGAPEVDELIDEVANAVVKVADDYTAFELDRIREYQNGVGVNIILRDADSAPFPFQRALAKQQLETPLNQQQIASLDSALDKGKLTKDTVLYRGLNLQLANLPAEGVTFVERGFVATTTNKEVAKGFGTVIEIRVPAGTHAIDVSTALGEKTLYDQKEFLLPRDVKWKVVKEGDRVILEYVSG